MRVRVRMAEPEKFHLHCKSFAAALVASLKNPLYRDRHQKSCTRQEKGPARLVMRLELLSITLEGCPYQT